jgi:hypothetical protein
MVPAATVALLLPKWCDRGGATRRPPSSNYVVKQTSSDCPRKRLFVVVVNTFKVYGGGPVQTGFQNLIRRFKEKIISTFKSRMPSVLFAFSRVDPPRPASRTFHLGATISYNCGASPV